MQWQDEGFITRAIVFHEQSLRLFIFTKDHGLTTGIQRYTKNKATRQQFQRGNLLRATWRARLEDHLGEWRTELIKPFGGYALSFPQQKLLVFESTLALLSHLLPERMPMAQLYDDSLQLLNLLIGNDRLADRKDGDDELANRSGDDELADRSGDDELADRSGDDELANGKDRDDELANGKDRDDELADRSGDDELANGDRAKDKNGDGEDYFSAYCRFEYRLLAHLGYGFDATDDDEVLLLNHNRGEKLSTAQARGELFLPLPPFLFDANASPTATCKLQALTLSGYFLERIFISLKKTELPTPRQQLLKMLASSQKMGG